MKKIENQEIISFYGKLLEPLGFVIVPKKVSDYKTPKPKNIERYENLDVVGIEKALAELKIKTQNLNKVSSDIKEKAISFMNRQTPNNYTEPLYTGMYGKNVINKTSVKVINQELDETTQLMRYLEEIKIGKIQQELLSKAQEEDNLIRDLKIVRGVGSPTLVVSISEEKEEKEDDTIGETKESHKKKRE